MKSYFRKMLLVLMAVLFASAFLFAPDSLAKKKKPKVARPNNAVIFVEQVPGGLMGLVVPTSFNAAIVNILSAETDAESSLVVFNQEGIGLIKTDGDLPSTFSFTATFKGLKKGKTTFSLGEVVDKLGGTPIEGAVASTTVKKIKVK